MKWYAYNDDGTNYTMLLDRNTTAYVDKYLLTNTQLINDTTSWNSTLNSRLITANEVASIIGIKNIDFSVSGVFYFDTLSSQVPDTYRGEYGWLYDNQVPHVRSMDV